MTEKRSICLILQRYPQAQIECDRMEKLDATGHNEMFGDNDINFDLELDKFGVEKRVLKVSEI